MPGSDDGDLKEIAAANLDAWQRSGVVKTLKYYSADDADVCVGCRKHHGVIIAIADGSISENLPPLDACVNNRCRCYFRPWDISVR